MKYPKELPHWRGLIHWASARQILFDRIKAKTGFSRYDMSNDENIRQCLDEAFNLGKKYGREGIKFKELLNKEVNHED